MNTGPRRTRESQVAVCRKLGDTTEAYYCTQPGHYCCTPDTPAIVKTDWGVCNRGRGDEDNQENVEDMEHLADDLDDTEEDTLATSANQEVSSKGITFLSKNISLFHLNHISPHRSLLLMSRKHLSGALNLRFV